jgi:hypothetical protein
MFRSKNKLKAELQDCPQKIKTSTFDFSKIERYFRNNEKQEACQVIPDHTVRDLDLEDVFTYLDRTSSKVGQQYFYHIFRTIPTDQKRRDRFEKQISILEKNPKLKEATLGQLSRLDNPEAYYIPSLFQEDHIQKPSWFWVIPVLALASVLSALLSFFFPPFLILLVGLLAVNYFIHYWNKANLYQYASSLPQLLIINQVVKKLLKSEVLSEKVEGLKGCTEDIDSIGARMSVFKLEAKLQSEVGQAVELRAGNF